MARPPNKPEFSDLEIPFPKIAAAIFGETGSQKSRNRFEKLIYQSNGDPQRSPAP